MLRLDDDGVRAEPPRLEHRHRRAHAEGARDVAGGRRPRRACRRRRSPACRRATGRRASRSWRRRRRNRHARSSACRSRDGATRRGEPQAGQRGAARRRRRRQSRQKPGHHGTIRAPSAAAERRRARARRRSGSMPACLREGEQQRLVAADVVEHAGQEARLARGGADLVRADAGQRRGSGRSSARGSRAR